MYYCFNRGILKCCFDFSNFSSGEMFVIQFIIFVDYDEIGREKGGKGFKGKNNF